MFHLAVLLLLSVGCVLGVLTFHHIIQQRLDHYASLREKHRTISDVSLVISKNVSRMQVGFQHMLLASSPGDLRTAEETIRESMETVKRAADFIESGGVFVESFTVNFEGLDRVGHEFHLTGPVPGLDVASMELRTSVSLLEKMLEEYHAFVSAGMDMGGHFEPGQLVLMHKKLFPFFSRTSEHANRFYVQSLKNLEKVQDRLEEVERLHIHALNFFIAGSVVLLALLGALVIRSASQVLRERASAQASLLALNEDLEGRVEKRTRELRMSEGRLRDIALTSGDIIWQTDGLGRLVYLTGHCERLLGVTPEEAMGLPILDFLGDPRERHIARTRLERQPPRSITDFVCSLVSRSGGASRRFVVNAIPVTDEGGDGASGGFFGVAKDISEKYDYERRLRLYEKIFETIQEGITVTDANGTILVVNPAFTAITGYTPEEAIGGNPRILKSEHHPPEFYETMWDTLRAGGLWTGEIWNRRKSGEAFPEWLSITPLRGEHGEEDKYIAVFHDITAMKEKEQEILRMAYYDHLTGLPNRTMLLEKFGVARLRAERSSVSYALVYVDLDNFKIVNDSLGHEAGDELLVEVAGRFQRLIRSDDLVARLGGDEFVFLFGIRPDSRIDASIYSERIKEALAAPLRIKGQEIYVTPSIGIAMFPRDGESIQALLKHADLAMYAAKSTGKNQYRFFDEEMTRKASARLTLENRLRQALSRGGVFPLFQPKVDLKTRRVIGVEALARWADDDGKIISPLEFIPVAEDTGLIIPLGRSILLQSGEAMRAVLEQTGRPLKVAVNVSARQFRHEGFIDDVSRAVQKAGLPFQDLELEITESLLLGDMGQAGSKLRAISDLGAAISVDDFGTGYSSLSYLSQLPIDRIKIDRSFILRLHGSQNDMDLLQAIIQMGRSLRMRVLAEGVETQEDAETLTLMGCDEAQGYFFGRPMPLHELIHFLRKSPQS